MPMIHNLMVWDTMAAKNAPLRIDDMRLYLVLTEQRMASSKVIVVGHDYVIQFYLNSVACLGNVHLR